MRVVVPFGAAAPKTRLAPVLDDDERRDFAAAMLRDVLDALGDRDVTVLAEAPLDAVGWSAVAVDAPVQVDDRALSTAVNAVLGAHDGAVAVVMADLPLATPAALDRLFATDGDVVVAPGLGGGTNALVVRHPDFRVDYHGASVRDHREAARALDADLAEVDSFRLATDVDEPGDLAEVLLHAEGEAADWLRDAGAEIAVRGGRVGVRFRGEVY